MPKKRKVSFLAICAIITILIFAGCAPTPTEPTAPTTPTVPTTPTTPTTPTAPTTPAEPIKIGIAGTITGEFGPWWDAVWEIGNLAVIDINKDPPLGRPLEVLMSDTQTTAPGAVDTATYFGGQGVAFAAGYSSDGLWAALDVIERFGTPTFSQWAGSSRLDTTDAGKNRLFYRLVASDTISATLYAFYWETELKPQGLTRIAVLSSTDEASISTTTAAQDALEKVGAEIVYHTEFPPDQPTFARVLSEAFDSEPDIIFLGTNMDAGTIIFKEWWDSSFTKDIFWMIPEDWVAEETLPVFMPAEGAFDDRLLANKPAGGEALREYIGEGYNVLERVFKEVYGSDAEILPDHEWGLSMWDCIVVGALAIQAAGDPSPDAVRNHIVEVSNPPGVVVHSFAEGKQALLEGKDIDYHGAASDANFDEYGNTYRLQEVVMVIDGKWTPIMTFTPDEQLEFMESLFSK